MRRNAIVLCSGGLDSIVTSFYVKKKLKYKTITILFFNYNQKSLISERKFSKLCSRQLNSRFIEIKLDWLGKLSKSLINKPGKLGNIKNLRDTSKESEKYYVPCRNLIFLSSALGIAESMFKECDIFVGFKCEGKESYPDTTQEFLEDMNKVARSCNGKFRIIAPLIKKDKEDIIQLGIKLGVNFRKTHSCYTNNKPCGKCLACKLRQAGFYWANLKDPTSYVN